ncbi:MAG: hypothetical protein ACLRVN_08210 [Butyricicoccus sp.]
MPNMNPKKCPMPEQAPDVRNKNFEEVTLGYTAEMAIEEAQRCLNCKNKPCMTGCPVQVKIPEFIALVAEGKFLEQLPRSRKPPSARCLRPCMPTGEQWSATAPRHQGEVAIDRLERFVAKRENSTRKAVKRNQRPWLPSSVQARPV